MNVFRKLKLVFLGAILLAAVPVSTASAAGNAAFTAEGASSAQTGTQFTAVVYVSPSGASFLNGSLTLNLSNLTFQSFNSAGNFASAAPVNGCSAGATTCTLSFYNITSGVSTKTAVGTLTINATGAAGASGQITLSGASADDSTGDPMAPSTANRSISITAPPTTTPPTTGGGGTTTTPPPAGSNPNTTNPISNPNPGSTVSVPNDNGEGQIVSEEEYSLAAAGDISATGEETVAVATNKSSLGLIVKLAIGLGIVGLVAVGAKLLLGRMARARELNRHVAGSGGTAFVGGAAEDAPKPPGEEPPQNNPPSGPTIITPQQ